MSLNTTAIGNAVNAAQRANGGKTFISPLDVANKANVKVELYGLLAAYVGGEVYYNVPADDLAALYASTLKDTGIGKAVCDRIVSKYGNPITGQAPRQFTPPAPPAPTPRQQPDPFAPDMSAYAKRTELDALKDEWRTDKSALRSSVSSDLSALRSDFTETMLKLAEAMPDVVKGHCENVVPLAVAEALKAMTPTRVEIVSPSAPPVAIGLSHNKFPQLLQMLAAGENVYAHGPAGSGKTTAAHKAATAFGVPFYFAAKVESEYMLLGFKDARGETVRTQFREAYEHGGLFLFDEMDASSPSAIVALNAALANGFCPFPDGVISKHPNFKCVGGGNTKLSGATRQYTGRTQLDAASIDRFAFLEWGYDNALEMELAGNKEWCLYVQAVRAAIAERQLPHLVSPRATYSGSNLLAMGTMTGEEVADAVIWKGLDPATVAQVLAKVTVPLPQPVKPTPKADDPFAAPAPAPALSII